MSAIYAKIAGLAIVAALLAGLFAWGHHVGTVSVQDKWDAAKGVQATAAVAASEAARTTERGQVQAFAGITTTYLQATTHAYPSIADTLPAAVAAGAVRLRNDCPAAGSGGVSSSTAGARAADAAATQALADRVSAGIAAVRAGDAADARERQLGAQVTALQAILSAERSPPRPNP